MYLKVGFLLTWMIVHNSRVCGEPGRHAWRRALTVSHTCGMRARALSGAAAVVAVTADT